MNNRSMNQSGTSASGQQISMEDVAERILGAVPKWNLQNGGTYTEKIVDKLKAQILHVRPDFAYSFCSQPYWENYANERNEAGYFEPDGAYDDFRFQ